MRSASSNCRALRRESFWRPNRAADLTWTICAFAICKNPINARRIKRHAIALMPSFRKQQSLINIIVRRSALIHRCASVFASAWWRWRPPKHCEEPRSFPFSSQDAARSGTSPRRQRSRPRCCRAGPPSRNCRRRQSCQRAKRRCCGRAMPNSTAMCRPSIPAPCSRRNCVCCAEPRRRSAPWWIGAAITACSLRCAAAATVSRDFRKVRASSSTRGRCARSRSTAPPRPRRSAQAPRSATSTWRPGAHGLAFPGGSCPTVGVAGHALGGGYGFLARPFGLACDNVLSVDLIDPQGHAVTRRPQSQLGSVLGLPRRRRRQFRRRDRLPASAA